MLFAGLIIFPFLLASTSIVKAAPGFEFVQPSKRQSGITTLSSAKISSFTPFTYFASAAYCNPSTTISYTCGGTSSISLVLQRWSSTRFVLWSSSLCEQQIALQTRTLSQRHREATVILCSSVGVLHHDALLVSDDDLIQVLFMMKGTLDFRHRMERSS